MHYLIAILIGLVLCFLLYSLAPAMVGAIPTMQDESMVLQDTVTKTASFNSNLFDLGSGFAPGGLGMPAAAVIDVSAADRTTGDETYSFKLQESPDGGVTWNDIGVPVNVPVNGNVATLGVIVAKGFITQSAVRVALTAAGTTPSITYKAWLNTTMQR